MRLKNPTSFTQSSTATHCADTKFVQQSNKIMTDMWELQHEWLLNTLKKINQFMLVNSNNYSINIWISFEM